MGFVAHHITLLVNNSLGGGYTVNQTAENTIMALVYVFFINHEARWLVKIIVTTNICMYIV